VKITTDGKTAFASNDAAIADGLAAATRLPSGNLPLKLVEISEAVEFFA
jgi:hypothetical protein